MKRKILSSLTVLAIAFDLDGTLLTEGYGEFPTEPSGFLTSCLLPEPLRRGTIPLLRSLQRQGASVGIYTASRRNALRVWLRFALSGVFLRRVVNDKAHQKQVKRGMIPAGLIKYPPAFGFDLLIENEPHIAHDGERHGFRVVLLAPNEPHWQACVLAQLLSTSCSSSLTLA